MMLQLRGTETSYILIATQQWVEMPMFSVQSLCKTIRLLLKCYITEIQKKIYLDEIIICRFYIN